MKVVLGTMTIGDQASSETGSSMLDHFVGAGYDEIDTAYVYNKGKTESILGEVLPGKNYQKNLIIAGKANPKGPGRLTAAGISEQLATSLERLKRPYLDLFYLHSPDLETPIDESLLAINEAHQQGTIKAFGLSNYAAWQVAQIVEKCESNGWVKPVCYQGMYNALTRDVERELFLCLQDYELAFYAYNPLAGGLLSGKYGNSSQLPESGRFSYHESYPDRYWKETNHRAVGSINDCCDKNGISTAGAALRWMLHHSALASSDLNKRHAVIIGASNMDQLTQNTLACSEGPLPTELLEVFDEAWEQTRVDCIKYFRP